MKFYYKLQHEYKLENHKEKKPDLYIAIFF